MFRSNLIELHFTFRRPQMTPRMIRNLLWTDQEQNCNNMANLFTLHDFGYLNVPWKDAIYNMRIILLKLLTSFERSRIIHEQTSKQPLAVYSANKVVSNQIKLFYFFFCSWIREMVMKIKAQYLYGIDSSFLHQESKAMQGKEKPIRKL